MDAKVLEGGTITDVPGFRAAGVHSGLKKKLGALDLALVVSEAPAVGVAVFTTNRFQAAPVLFNRERLSRGQTGLRVVAINSGCANACTGPEGLEDAREMARLAAEAAGAPADSALVMSTGVIGQRLKMDRVAAGLKEAAAALSQTGGPDAARAIMTTDTRPKTAAVQITVGGKTVTLAGMAKGAGMISPNMATMLSMIATDAAVDPAALRDMLVYAVDRSFNCVTVDGDMSTNDTLLVLANGVAGNAEVTGPSSEGYEALRDGLTVVAQSLAQQVAFDGEGATKRVTITVRGAADRAEGRRAAMSVANSPLVKTAIYGKDANWGRILCAVGYSGVSVDPDNVDLWLGDLHLVLAGRPHDVDEERASAILERDDIDIIVDLDMGQETVTVWTCDLSHEYVSINADYRT